MLEGLCGRMRIILVAAFLLSLISFSGCAFLLGDLVGLGAGTVAGAVSKSPTTGAAAGGATGAGVGALVGYAVGGPLAGAVGGGLSGARAGYVTGRAPRQKRAAAQSISPKAARRETISIERARRGVAAGCGTAVRASLHLFFVRRPAS